MKTDKEKFIELMESFGLEPESIFDIVNKNSIESLDEKLGFVSFVFDQDEKFSYIYTEDK